MRLERKATEQIDAIDTEVQELTTPSTADPILTGIAEAVNFPAWWAEPSIEDRLRLVNLLMEIHISRGKQGRQTL
ncbi:hypothetical protein OS125_06575 [Corynebacterium sp. P7003]|uniref:Uncharacterized protein n=1 Tax=Corynebacterium pygosceleis TaxID=2800406 RepID=A0ABT3WRP8_9CORY|nr:hypothetical protein [Corynebacterium pygosceleis]MCX7444910.1 hypothetical protein [Corynebacterium pygosceleis]